MKTRINIDGVTLNNSWAINREQRFILVEHNIPVTDVLRILRALTRYHLTYARNSSIPDSARLQLNMESAVKYVSEFRFLRIKEAEKKVIHTLVGKGVLGCEVYAFHDAYHNTTTVYASKRVKLDELQKLFGDNPLWLGPAKGIYVEGNFEIALEGNTNKCFKREIIGEIHDTLVWDNFDEMFN